MPHIYMLFERLKDKIKKKKTKAVNERQDLIATQLLFFHFLTNKSTFSYTKELVF